MAEVTTMKISTATRDRLRAARGDGETLEDVVVSALDAYESLQFWAAAETAGAEETQEQRHERKLDEAQYDTWIEGVR